MPAAAIIAPIAGSIIGGMMSSGAQSDAAGQAAASSDRASERATALQRQVFEQQRADQTPWRNTGANALAQLSYGMGLGDTNQGYGVSNALGSPTATQTQAPQTQDLANIWAAIQSLGRANAGGPGWVPSTYTNGDVDSWAYVGLPSESIQQQQQPQQQPQNAQIGPQAPFQGQGVAGDLMRPFGMSDYQEDPGYQFRLKEGLNALEKSAAARGGLLSGGALKGITRYGQEAGSQEYQNAYNRYQSNQSNQFNRLASIAGIGQTANNALGQAGQNYANQAGYYSMQNGANQGNAMLSAGDARASSYGGMGNALGTVDWGKLGGGSSSTLRSPYTLDSFYTGNGTGGD